MIVISGPCVIENEDKTFLLAEILRKSMDGFPVRFIFKASFDKANRTSIDSFRGVGIEKGLEILGNVKKYFGIEIITDVHEAWQVEQVAEVVDVIQIPAFLCRQTDLITEVAKSGRMINIKKGQFLSPYNIKYIIEKIRKYSNDYIFITERGVSFGYGDLVFDPRSIPIMKKFGYPVIIDASHSVQKPYSGIDYTGGNPEFIPVIAKAGIAAGADGVFIEIHDEPDKALCDKDNCLDIGSLESLILDLLHIKRYVNP